MHIGDVIIDGNNKRMFFVVEKITNRFFPFYTFNLLAGFDENGRGQVINYDAVGSGDFKKYAVLGSSA